MAIIYEQLFAFKLMAKKKGKPGCKGSGYKK